MSPASHVIHARTCRGLTRFRAAALRAAALACAAALVLGLAPDAASAQEPPTDEFSTTRFVPAPGPGNFLMVESAAVVGDLAPSFGLTIDYAHQPFTLYEAECDPADTSNCELTGTAAHLVEHAATAHLQLALAIAGRVEVGLLVPFSYSDGESFAYTPPGATTFTSLDGGSGVALGDPRLSAKVRLTEPGALGLAAVVYGSAPLGQLTAEGHYAGDAGPTVGGHLIGEFENSGFHLAGNVGGVYRQAAQLFSTEVGPELTYGLGVGYDVTPLLTVFGELHGSSSFTTQVDENPLEGRVAGRFRIGRVALTLGAGGGLISGVGVPLFRVVGGVGWAPDTADQDGDGVLDADDRCPGEPEDFDNFYDEDGCPEPDNDSDGMADGDDPCPNEPEDQDGYEDEDGCPDLDNDGDGIQDGYDSCPMEPEDMDGDNDEDGCPDNDTDRDGIPDETDQCPNEAEDTDGFGDEDGCPEVDFDGDTILDDSDECPDQPEVFNGVEDTDGCPEEDRDGDGIPDGVDQCPDRPETLNGRQDEDGCPDGNELVRIEGQRIMLLQQVLFATNRATIRGRQSRQILDAVATILARNPHYQRVRIEGHTDDRGNADTNRDLSQRRAQACVTYLVDHGIAAERLHAIGHGPDRPIEPNETAEGRAANRRVEFHIETAPQMVPASAAPAPAEAERSAVPDSDATPATP